MSREANLGAIPARRAEWAVRRRTERVTSSETMTFPRHDRVHGIERRFAGALAAALIALVLVVASAPPAFAHAELVTASPAPGDGLPQAPGAVVLKFTEPLNRRLSHVEVTDRAGRDVAVGATFAVTGDSCADGHVTTGAVGHLDVAEASIERLSELEDHRTRRLREAIARGGAGGDEFGMGERRWRRGDDQDERDEGCRKRTGEAPLDAVHPIMSGEGHRLTGRYPFRSPTHGPLGSTGRDGAQIGLPAHGRGIAFGNSCSRSVWRSSRLISPRCRATSRPCA